LRLHDDVVVDSDDDDDDEDEDEFEVEKMTTTTTTHVDDMIDALITSDHITSPGGTCALIVTASFMGY